MMTSADRKKVVTHFLDAVRARDFAAMDRLFTEDVTNHLPYPPEGSPDEVSGREKVVEFYRAALKDAKSVDIYDVEMHVTEQSGLVIVFCKSKAEFHPQRRYANKYVFVYRVEGERIAEFWEYFDPRAFEMLSSQ